MPVKNAYLDFVAEWLSPLGGITARAMMGGHILYCDCVVFALIAHNTLYLKADAETRPRFEALGLKPFFPFEGKASMSYYQPPAEFFEDEEAMLEWSRTAVGAGQRAKKKKPAARRRK